MKGADGSIGDGLGLVFLEDGAELRAGEAERTIGIGR